MHYVFTLILSCGSYIGLMTLNRQNENNQQDEIEALECPRANQLISSLKLKLCYSV